MGLYAFPPLKVAMGLLSLFSLIAKINDSETHFYVKINWICDELFYRLSGEQQPFMVNVATRDGFNYPMKY